MIFVEGDSPTHLMVNVDPDAAAEFVQKDHAIELLLRLDYDDRIHFTELKEDFDKIGSDTLAIRLSEAEDIGLIDSGHQPRSTYNQEACALTEWGAKLRLEMLKSGIQDAFIRIQSHKLDFEKGPELLEDFIEDEWIQSNSPESIDPNEINSISSLMSDDIEVIKEEHGYTTVGENYRYGTFQPGLVDEDDSDSGDDDDDDED
jgi:DNA-binding HxlR family transcriptional regulator